MLQAVLLLAFCLLMGLVALVACVWVAATGQLLTMDGLLIVAISLTLGGAFMAMVVYSWKTGEISAILNEWRSQRKAAEGGAKDRGDSGNQGPA